MLGRAHDDPLELEEHASQPLVGGISLRGHQCGQVWGAALAGGAKAYRRFGAGATAQSAAIVAAQGIMESFDARNGNVDCQSITGVDFTEPRAIPRYFLKNGVKCLRIAAQYAPVAFGEIDAALADVPDDVPELPVSCAAVVAERMGASELHTVIAAGLAAGIGLSGHACGALGAAVWMTDMQDREHGADKVGYENPRVSELIERFEEFTEGTFGCAEIVGRRFTSIDDHATYVRGGGCARLIDVLAKPRDDWGARA